MIPVIHHVEDAAEHPYVDAFIDGVLEVHVDHFGGPVHEGGVLLKPLFVFVDFRLGNSSQVNLLPGTAPKVAELGYTLTGQQDVLYFHVLVHDAEPVHLLQSHHDIPNHP